MRNEFALFKIRGAYYAISQLSKEERERGVVCASAEIMPKGVAYTCNEWRFLQQFYAYYNTATKRLGRFAFFGGEFVTIKLVGDTFDASAKAAPRIYIGRKPHLYRSLLMMRMFKLVKGL